MTDEIGGNARQELMRIANQISEHLDTIAECQDQVKQLRAEARALGFDVKVLNRCITERRKGPEYQADQLELELVLDTYRKAFGLPRNFADAQAAHREQIEQGGGV